MAVQVVHAQDTAPQTESAGPGSASPQPGTAGSEEKQTGGDQSVVPTIPVEPVDGTRAESPAAEDSQATQLEAIVVTAQKRAQHIQDVPIAMSAIGEDAIRDRRITGFSDIAAQMPSVQYGEGAGAGQVFIRGVGLSMLSGSGEGSVATYVDGLYIARPTAATMLQTDIGGIEVLRGPQGTLYGRNTNGGVINFTTIHPPADFSADLGVSYGNLESRKFAGSVGAPLVSDVLNGRISITSENLGNYIKNVEFPGQDVGGRDHGGLRASLDFFPTEALLLEFRGFAAQDQGNGPVYTEPYRPGSGAALIEPGSYDEDPEKIKMNDHVFQEIGLYGGTVKATFDWTANVSISSTTGYAYFEQSVHDEDGDGTSNRIFTSNRGTESNTFSQELLLNWEGGFFSGLLGGFYLKDDLFQRLDTDVYVDQNPNGGDARADLFDRVNNLAESQSVFTDATVNVLSKLRVLAGIRYVVDKKDFVQTSMNIVKNPPSPDQPTVECQHLRLLIDEKNFTGRAGLQYDFSDDVKTYTTYSTGFKAGGFNIAACNDGFLPEKIKAYEVGMKSSWFDHRLQLNLFGFYYDYVNLQVEQLEFPALRVANATAKVDGAELELTVLPLEQLEVSAGLTYLDARYTQFSNADNGTSVTAPPEDVSGNPLNRSPRWASVLAPEYRMGLADWGGLTLRAEAQYSSSYTFREFNTPDDRQESYTRLNAFLRYTNSAERLSLSAYVKNATDELVFSNIIGVVGNRAAGYELPRTFGLEARYRWGA